MKLIIEQHPELSKLISYFKKIEAIAERLGIDVDELVSELKPGNASMYMSFKKKILSQAHQRAELLLKINPQKHAASDASIVGLTIIINNDRKN
ncbi:MAG: hypothetical protein IPQ03_16295 [Bacteroidetes bacterium]|nr:hypothetical protein [Bacteroidota bacterium]MBK9523382.1 hypothetical protein [Bacteroidota bacterium]MBL0259000.1 hypothetical protein [Bacteroidota bacterium]MBP6403382.1 hypothetical protein [Bacteroidia bacterium]MBP6649167.1 hypothetical protein [Bacteroidia bacterium]